MERQAQRRQMDADKMEEGDEGWIGGEVLVNVLACSPCLL